MEKFLVVTDTTSAMDKQIAKEYGIELVSLSVIIDGKEYKDQIDMTTEELYEKLKEGAVPTTSQPNQGYVQGLMEEWKKENYDAIIIVTCSSGLSGSWSGFNLAATSVGLDNCYVVDSKQIGSPVMDMAIYAKIKADQGASVKEIIDGIKEKTEKSFSFLTPETFDQLKKGGRLSPAAATFATMLKIKAMLYMKEDGSCVEKFEMARTENKLIKSVIEKFQSLNVDASTHRLYLAHANNLDRANKIKNQIIEKFEGIECIVSSLPAVLTCHGGLGCVSIHSISKEME